VGKAGAKTGQNAPDATFFWIAGAFSMVFAPVQASPNARRYRRIDYFVSL